MRNNQNGIVGVCPSCACQGFFKVKRLMKCPILPIKFYGRNNPFIFLCDSCSKEIKFLLNEKKQSKKYSYALFKEFVRGGYVNIPWNKRKNGQGKIKTACSRCFNTGEIQKHHMLPVEHFGDDQYILYIDHDCHKIITEVIQSTRKLTKEQYFELHRIFLIEKNKDVLMKLAIEMERILHAA